jgi:hypothetical protein
MAEYKITAPDGKILKITAPEGASQEDVLNYAKEKYTVPKKYNLSDVPEAAMQNAGQDVGNIASDFANIIQHPLETGQNIRQLGAGLVSKVMPEGMGNPVERAKAEAVTNAVGQQLLDQYGSWENIKRSLAERPVGSAIDAATIMFGGGKALTTAGKLGQAGNVATRAGEKIIQASDIINPMNIVTKGIPAAAPYVGQAADKSAKYLMQSALKPTIEQLKSGDAAVAINELLKRGINPTASGVAKIKDIIDSLNTQIKEKIGASTEANATINKQDVINRALSSSEGYQGLRERFGTTVNPTADLNAIEKSILDFQTTSPNKIPVKRAQDLKTNTYKSLSGKFGEETSAAVETQKGLARGIKEELEVKIPEIAGLNAEEKLLIRTLNVADRRALMELNKNPFGLAILAGDAASRAVFMADKSAAFKSILARMIYRSKELLSKPQVTQNVKGLLETSQPYAAPAATGAGLLNNLPQ